ncbi:phosphate acyltransferase PlsX [Ferrimicrobium acidiphilum]|uniref:Phosphate acyltransferase n=1 Tax=Ferrimicrobium acidiphilum DSM 19497 TaxID=1121877 RepID=A0A0D8FVR4_9ACTN|nr:phosphate acyltransferase PlsX [Ferrimicrobium acidiphilum]KJE77365.1 phosphate acyltransferase [Ferrimicrobium acidiphilum DSM 19497]MCL5973112.1 phosphate acyltransferase PlsX [Actinomycetota bacterium]
MNPVAVDLMGGDSGPAVIVEGVLAALEDMGGEIVVVGNEEAVRPLVGDSRVRIVHASEEILMSDDPASAPRRKRDASMVVGATLLKAQEVSAFITFGNSGAAMATALVKVGRIRGVARPAITIELPVPGTTSTVLLDAGANTEVIPQWLHQFAVMGSVYCSARLGIDLPRVGLLSIGEEAGKGNALVKETYPLLAEEPSINFLGNVEGRDIMSDRVDVVVTDGFTGNVVLKSLEGAAHLFAHAVLAALSEGDDGVLDAALPKLLPLWNQMTPDDTGAAALLGVNGLFLIGHGASNARAVSSAVRNARQLAEAGVVQTIRRLEGSAGE